MASIANGGAEDGSQSTGKTLKEGERILGPTRRPDGTLRKPIRIRPGYVPQDEWRKEVSATQEVPPGCDPAVEAKRSKAAKRNERKKEKRQQAALDKGKNSEQNDTLLADCSGDLPENVESVSSKMNGLSVSGSASVITPPDSTIECPIPTEQVQDIDKKIRALKKKIRLTEAQQQKAGEKDLTLEQSKKLEKLEGWLSELKLLEEMKGELNSSLS